MNSRQGPECAADLLSQDAQVYMQGIHQRMSGQVAGLLASIPTGSWFHDFYGHAFGGEASYKRSALVYITGDAFGEDRSSLDRFALVSEQVQTASLVYDDWQDKSPKRRGQSAAYIRFGAEKAINGASAIAFDAFGEAAAVEAESWLETGRLTRYVSHIMGSRGMCLGQAEDMAAQTQYPEDMTLEKLDRIAHLKTGLAIEMAVVGAARICRVRRGQRLHLQDYARHFGIAYQIKDDLSDTASGADGSNYVNVLGAEAAAAQLDHRLEQAEAAIAGLSPDINTIRFREMLEQMAAQEQFSNIVQK